MDHLVEVINACSPMIVTGITAYGSIRTAKILQGKNKKPLRKKNKKK